MTQKLRFQDAQDLVSTRCRRRTWLEETTMQCPGAWATFPPQYIQGTRFLCAHENGVTSPNIPDIDSGICSTIQPNSDWKSRVFNTYWSRRGMCTWKIPLAQCYFISKNSLRLASESKTILRLFTRPARQLQEPLQALSPSHSAPFQVSPRARMRTNKW